MFYNVWLQMSIKVQCKLEGENLSSYFHMNNDQDYDQWNM